MAELPEEVARDVGAGVAGAPRVFLDACVLYPPLVRALLLGAAEAGLFAPTWSERVLEEWRIAVAAKQGLAAETDAVAARKAMAARFPAGCVQADAFVEAAARLPDPADAHVLAAAVAGRVDVLLTFNMRDFPRPVLARHGIEARHPDGFLWQLLSVAPERMAPVISGTLEEAGIPPDRARAALKRAKLPRLGKAWQATAGEAPA